MYKRIVNDAIETGLVKSEELVGQTDEGFLYMIETRAADSEIGTRVRNLRNRVLPKRALELVAAESDFDVPDWAAIDSPKKREAEETLAREIGAGARAELRARRSRRHIALRPIADWIASARAR